MKGKFGSMAGGIGVGWIILIGVAIVGLWLAFSLMSFHNVEIRQRNLLTMKQKDNTSEFDNMKKTIREVAQVSDYQFDKLREVFTSYAEARTPGKDGNAPIMNWIQEAIPDVDTKTFENLQNIIVGQRAGWTQRQKELLDMKRVHDNILDVGFRGLILTKCFGRDKIEVQIVTSGAAKMAFASGEDNDTDVFGRKPVPVENP